MGNRIISWRLFLVSSSPLIKAITSDILPLDVWHLHDGFPKTGGVALSHREFEVVLTDRHLVQNRRVDLVVLDVEQVHLLPDALKSTFSAELGHVRAHETVRLLSYRRQLHVLVKLHVLSVDAQDLQTPDLVRHPYYVITVCGMWL